MLGTVRLRRCILGKCGICESVYRYSCLGFCSVEMFVEGCYVMMMILFDQGASLVRSSNLG